MSPLLGWYNTQLSPKGLPQCPNAEKDTTKNTIWKFEGACSSLYLWSTSVLRLNKSNAHFEFLLNSEQAKTNQDFTQFFPWKSQLSRVWLSIHGISVILGLWGLPFWWKMGDLPSWKKNRVGQIRKTKQVIDCRWQFPSVLMKKPAKQGSGYLGCCFGHFRALRGAK